MESFFWDTEGILIDYREKNKTIIGEYYTSLLDRLKRAITKTCPRMVKKKVLFHQDNAPVHSSRVAQQ